MQEESFLVATPDDFTPVIQAILEKAATTKHKAALITLSGDLGAGKTTFTQQVAKQLGVVEHVVSPTFGIMKGYELSDHPHFDRLIHIDAYRIEDIAEAGPLRLVEIFSTPRTLVCLEWPEQIAEILPEEKIAVSIQIKADDQRMVVLK